MTTPTTGSDTNTPRIAISGASGLLGGALIERLRIGNVVIQRLRRGRGVTAPDIAWDPERGEIDAAALEGVDAVVHLAGEPIAHRWNAERKRRILDSRVAGTTLLARTLAGLWTKPRVLLSGSAVGYYGDRGDEPLDESSAPGSDFLARVAVAWERSAAPASDAGIRVVLARSGVVLAAHGGALEKMLIPFRLGAGGRAGSGRQWVSWIALDDWVRAAAMLLETEALAGAVNIVAPNPVPNEDFARTLGRVIGRPAIAALPAFAVEVMFGEMGRATLLASQRVSPRRLLEAGFRFEWPTLEQALHATLDAPRAPAA